MRILLVNMPWSSIDVPSLALGILTNSVRQKMPDAEVEVMHANLDFVDWVVDRREFGLGDYYYYSLFTYFSGCGDWVFSSALYDDPEWRVSEFTRVVQGQMSERDLSRNMDLHRAAPEFIDEIAARIVDRAPDLVGFTSTFQQNTAALATARAVKKLDPRIRTALGGANCDGEQGAALHRNFSFIDFVVRGEGEAAFPQLLTALAAAPADSPADFSSIEGLCWATPDGRHVANPMSTAPLPPAEIVSPDYTGYFERLARSKANNWVEPRLVVEGARGCWWGEKHHCTFCGLNGSFMQFRSKHPGRFYDEIIGLVERHQVLDMFVVDNILDMSYVNSLLPRLAESDYDLRLQYEIKSNMRGPQVQALADAGLVSVQPGIENLNSRVLKIMDKGVTGCLNVRMLRDAETSGITIAWNYLYGFPGETDADYQSIIDQMPALHHLCPPDGSTRIAIERFSPYFVKPELGFTDLRPAAQYRLIYDLPESELMDLAYIFDTPTQGIDEDLAETLDRAVTGWQHEYARSRLTHHDLGTEIVLVSERRQFDWHVLRLTDPTEVAAFRQLDQPHSVASLARRISASEEEVATLLARWSDLGLLFSDADQFIQIAPQAMNQDLLRIDHLHQERAAAQAEAASTDPATSAGHPTPEPALTAV
ncbi:MULTISPECIES: RiPP maturation radical SAM C-methyltransferase [unclassified Solwaraspora]|uniref:RiPP maturation radical SAM C-methyltransferase n=1 Tax=unclassified Solwaraspora TaxID=2627926 RepID=UPI00248CD109|nr:MULTISPECIES: RiPP maturation radical SAM C-methyltransferase [unclassified Solwaraspora]WBB96886.1 RiPP maturation radical SAM C-methyltransferase [Solwaraspora sp. WMMA2059]WBC19209.1 RiPP maturation radical SAM C-methyltransferase [Solwaraspora sp. WMMA2080]WJK33376.1 RiPP maturation radical SAM C-methyltransferase [Solwaraspora sp. WMMA2065]